tara:strand:- start:260 stop:439 length:180 start_codon:yes stop_codon:yes gene_type:complete
MFGGGRRMKYSYIMSLTKRELQAYATALCYEIHTYQTICLDLRKLYPDIHAELIMEDEE